MEVNLQKRKKIKTVRVILKYKTFSITINKHLN